MNKNKIKQARKQGMSAIEIAYIQEVARKESARIKAEYMDKAFLMMLAIPLNVLVSDYWSKSARQRVPKYIEEVMKLYQAVQDGTVTYQELADLLAEYGIQVEAEWLDGTDKTRDTEKA